MVDVINARLDTLRQELEELKHNNELGTPREAVVQARIQELEWVLTLGG